MCAPHALLFESFAAELGRQADTQSSMRLPVFLVTQALVVACSSLDRTSASNALPTRAEANWLRYEAETFTLRYPPSASLRNTLPHPSDLPGTAIVGPQIHIPIPPAQGPSDGSAYQLIVSAFPNPSGESVEQWVDSVRREANSHEMDADSLGFLAPPETLTVNGLHALRLQPFCGDCATEEVYIAGRRQTVVLSYVFDISFPGDPEAQRRLYSAILNTFSWKQ